MNNVVKSVIFAAVVLVAGIAAMQVIYNNVSGSDVAGIEPAAGEGFMGTIEENANEAADSIQQTTGEAWDATKETAEDAADAVQEAWDDVTAPETPAEIAEEAADDAEAAAQDAAEAAEDAADAAEEAVQAE